MLKIPKKTSVIISLVLTVVFFIGCIASAVFMPLILSLIVLSYESVLFLSAAESILFEALAYAVITVAAIAAILLFFLLIRVYHGEVFTSKSVYLIRGVSWCCFLIAAVFFIFTYFFILGASALAFVAILLGLCLRVVKNVIEEATEIKAENDLTV